MVPALFLVTTLLGDNDCKPNAPCYSAEGIVNAASNLPGPLASLTWVSIYGTSLSYNTRSRSSGDTDMGFGGVYVLVNNQFALLSYISPLQINFLLPYEINLQQATIQVVREGTAGPPVAVPLADCAPALFLQTVDTAIAAHSKDWTVVTPESPARAGEIIILYATGLGLFAQPLDYMEIPVTADLIQRRADFTLWLDDQAVDDKLVEYVGAAPLFTGVYQINLHLPDQIRANPEVRISLGDKSSPTGIRLLAQ
jgi:uncharacterized protein (TIGR03437 family)